MAKRAIRERYIPATSEELTYEKDKGRKDEWKWRRPREKEGKDVRQRW